MGLLQEEIQELSNYTFKEWQAPKVIAQIAEGDLSYEGLVTSLRFTVSFEYQRQQGPNKTLYRVYQLACYQWEERR